MVGNPWRGAAVEESKATEQRSNLSVFLEVLADLLSFFESTQKNIERSSSSRIVEKYPKFLSKFALFKL